MSRDLAKLPAWARDEIGALKARLRRAETMMARAFGMQETRVAVVHPDGTVSYVDEGAKIVVAGRGGSFHVKFDGDKVVVTEAGDQA